MLISHSKSPQLAVAIRSLDDLTERYEIENSILEEKVIEVINESKEKEVEVRCCLSADFV